MYSIKSIIFILIIFGNFIIQSFSEVQGTVSSQYGRISNMANDRIHVAAALAESDCIRQCVDFAKNHDEYIYEDCYAYNYDFDNFTCELIHSTEPINYIISIESRWKTGIKS